MFLALVVDCEGSDVLPSNYCCWLNWSTYSGRVGIHTRQRSKQEWLVKPKRSAKRTNMLHHCSLGHQVVNGVGL